MQCVFMCIYPPVVSVAFLIYLSLALLMQYTFVCVCLCKQTYVNMYVMALLLQPYDLFILCVFLVLCLTLCVWIETEILVDSVNRKSCFSLSPVSAGAYTTHSDYQPLSPARSPFLPLFLPSFSQQHAGCECIDTHTCKRSKKTL